MIDVEKVLLLRTEQSDEGTFGIIVFDGHSLFTGELPWRDNRANISCIPEGVYSVRVSDSRKFGRCYEIGEVPKRSHILLHHGNFCGDRIRGLRTNVAGCILVGCGTGRLFSQRAVFNSRTARRRFEQTMNFEDFILEVKDVRFPN